MKLKRQGFLGNAAIHARRLIAPILVAGIIGSSHSSAMQMMPLDPPKRKNPYGLAANCIKGKKCSFLASAGDVIVGIEKKDKNGRTIASIEMRVKRVQPRFIEIEIRSELFMSAALKKAQLAYGKNINRAFVFQNNGMGITMVSLTRADIEPANTPGIARITIWR